VRRTLPERVWSQQMRIRNRVLAPAALALVLALAAACGDSGGSSTATVPASPTQSFSAKVTPFPTPHVNDNNVVSESKGYSATFPAGWKFRANLIQTTDASVDTIFEPLLPDAKVQANIAVTCAVQRSLPPPARVEFEKTKTSREGLNHNIIVSETKVSGVDATVLTYTNVSQNDASRPSLDKQEIFFSNSKCDWTISTTTLAGDFVKYKAQFDAFIASFKLLTS
jgi:hypothetical protein